uniref:Uncharacterized protein n=1 Tax=Oryza glumipatula TaxID=40148 RepID=A0A0D9ZAZ4_9ORYZ
MYDDQLLFSLSFPSLSSSSSCLRKNSFFYPIIHQLILTPTYTFIKSNGRESSTASDPTNHTSLTSHRAPLPSTETASAIMAASSLSPRRAIIAASPISSAPPPTIRHRPHTVPPPLPQQPSLTNRRRRPHTDARPLGSPPSGHRRPPLSPLSSAPPNHHRPESHGSSSPSKLISTPPQSSLCLFASPSSAPFTDLRCAAPLALPLLHMAP